MRRLLLHRKTQYTLVLVIICYHVIFGVIRGLIDLTYPMTLYTDTIAAFGTELRIGIRQDISSQSSNMWYMVDFQPERQKHPERGFVGTILDNNVYDYVIEMGWFYQYKTLYAYGRNGFWIIQSDPFHIKLLRSENIPEKDSEELNETIAKYTVYGNQFTVFNAELDLTQQEKRAYALIKEKARPRIEKLKAEGLFP